MKQNLVFSSLKNRHANGERAHQFCWWESCSQSCLWCFPVEQLFKRGTVQHLETKDAVILIQEQRESDDFV